MLIPLACHPWAIAHPFPSTLPCSCSRVAVILEAPLPLFTPSFSLSLLLLLFPSQLVSDRFRLLLFPCSLPPLQFRPRDCTPVSVSDPQRRTLTRQHHNRPWFPPTSLDIPVSHYPSDSPLGPHRSRLPLLLDRYPIGPLAFPPSPSYAALDIELSRLRLRLTSRRHPQTTSQHSHQHSRLGNCGRACALNS